MRIEIKKDYIRQSNILKSRNYSRYYYPIIPSIVSNPANSKSISPSTEDFVFDSGASITILHERNRHLFDPGDEIEEMTVSFGGSNQKLKVYNIELKIDGYNFPMIAALSKKLNNRYSLLGYFEGFNNLDIIVMHNRKKEITLIKK